MPDVHEINPRKRAIRKHIDNIMTKRLNSEMPEKSFYDINLKGDVLTIQITTEAVSYLTEAYDGMSEAAVIWQRRLNKVLQKPQEERIWLGLQSFFSLAIPAAFESDNKLQIVRGNVRNKERDIYVFSVEANRKMAEGIHYRESSVYAKLLGTQGIPWRFGDIGILSRFDTRYMKDRDFNLQPIIPHGEDETAPQLVGGDDLFTTTPAEFEQCIAALFRSMGFAVTITGRVSDGGIDLVAHNSQPLVSGKYVIQCKRYQLANPVGVGEVRDLYGALTHEAANKGILVTTSRFTAEAQNFASGKPLELIDGVRLQQLLAAKLSEEPVAENRIADSKENKLEFLKTMFEMIAEKYEITIEHSKQSKISENLPINDSLTAKESLMTQLNQKLRRQEEKLLKIICPPSAKGLRDEMLTGYKLLIKSWEWERFRAATNDPKILNALKSDCRRSDDIFDNCAKALAQLGNKWEIQQEEVFTTNLIERFEKIKRTTI